MIRSVVFRKTLPFRLIAGWVLVCFGFPLMMPPGAMAQALDLPAPGSMVMASPVFMPVMTRGLKVHPENPLLFDFIVDAGDSGFAVEGSQFKAESEKLIKYFLASLTVKEDDQWVNLSPYEKDRMIPENLGKTELGRDMLAQDYILKQLTASLVYPEKGLGKEFWAKIYEKTKAQFGSIDVPVDTFNKVWITADKARVLERNNTAYVVGAHLKVMLEEDYQAAMRADIKSTPTTQGVRTMGVGEDLVSSRSEISRQVMRDIIIPQIEKEVNEGKNFSQLRQIFYAMILSTWYKRALKTALLNQVYSNKSKTYGVENADPVVKEKIYAQYLEAYRKGVFNYIKEETNAAGETIPRKYFSGGLDRNLNVDHAMEVVDKAEAGDDLTGKEFVDLLVGVNPSTSENARADEIFPEAQAILKEIKLYAQIPWQNWPADVLQWYSMRVARLMWSEGVAHNRRFLALLKDVARGKKDAREILTGNGRQRSDRDVAFAIGFLNSDGRVNHNMAALVDHMTQYYPKLMKERFFKAYIKPEFLFDGTIQVVKWSQKGYETAIFDAIRESMSDGRIRRGAKVVGINKKFDPIFIAEIKKRIHSLAFSRQNVRLIADPRRFANRDDFGEGRVIFLPDTSDRAQNGPASRILTSEMTITTALTAIEDILYASDLSADLISILIRDVKWFVGEKISSAEDKRDFLVALLDDGFKAYFLHQYNGYSAGGLVFSFLKELTDNDVNKMDVVRFFGWEELRRVFLDRIAKRVLSRMVAAKLQDMLLTPRSLGELKRVSREALNGKVTQDDFLGRAAGEKIGLVTRLPTGLFEVDNTIAASVDRVTAFDPEDIRSAKIVALSTERINEEFPALKPDMTLESAMVLVDDILLDPNETSTRLDLLAEEIRRYLGQAGLFFDDQWGFLYIILGQSRDAREISRQEHNIGKMEAVGSFIKKLVHGAIGEAKLDRYLSEPKVFMEQWNTVVDDVLGQVELLTTLKRMSIPLVILGELKRVSQMALKDEETPCQSFAGETALAIGLLKDGVINRSVAQHLDALTEFDEGDRRFASIIPDAMDSLDKAQKMPVAKVDGGIDINGKNLTLDVTREGKGIEMKLDPVIVARFERGDFTGVVPVILKVTPLASPLPLLGMSEGTDIQHKING